MKGTWKISGSLVLWIMATILGGLIVLALGFGSLLVLSVLVVVYGWTLYAFCYYRTCRRQELLGLLASSAENAVPLAPALRAYLHDRPRGTMRSFWLATMLAVFPVPGFYWIWYRRRNFDRYAEELAQLLENGVPLSEGLQRLPALANRETILAVAVGEGSGQMARCLRQVAERRLVTLWIDLVPQLLYPIVMFLIICSVVTILVLFLVPRLQAICRDFGEPLPPFTQSFIRNTEKVLTLGPLWIVCAQLIPLLVVLVVMSSTARWFVPGVGTVYRRLVRSRVLGLTGSLLEAGKSVPESLGVLATLPMGRTVLRRLERARIQVEQGYPFGESLVQVGLLSEHMLPLLHTAERTGNLPWALRELAESIHTHTMRLVQRTVQAVFPCVVVLFGIVVGVVVVALFVPLVALITNLAYDTGV